MITIWQVLTVAIVATGVVCSFIYYLVSTINQSLNQRIDDTSQSLNQRIDATNQRIDDTNQRITDLKSDFREALDQLEQRIMARLDQLELPTVRASGARNRNVS